MFSPKGLSEMKPSLKLLGRLMPPWRSLSRSSPICSRWTPSLRWLKVKLPPLQAPAFPEDSGLEAR